MPLNLLARVTASGRSPHCATHLMHVASLVVTVVHPLFLIQGQSQLRQRPGTHAMLRRLHAGHNVRVSGVGDGQHGHAVQLAARGTQVHVVAGVVVHAGLGLQGRGRVG